MLDIGWLSRGGGGGIDSTYGLVWPDWKDKICLRDQSRLNTLMRGVEVARDPSTLDLKISLPATGESFLTVLWSSA